MIDIPDWLVKFLIAMFLLGVLTLAILPFYFIFKIDMVKSKTRLEPQIELIINNNKVDTLFIYKEQK